MLERSGSYDPDEEEDVDVRRPLGVVSGDLASFGEAFFGGTDSGRGIDVASYRTEPVGAVPPAVQMLGSDVRPEGTAPAAAPETPITQTLKKKRTSAPASSDVPPPTPAAVHPGVPKEVAHAARMSPVETTQRPARRGLLLLLALLVVAALLSAVLFALLRPRSLPADEALALHREAVAAGDYAAASEVVGRLASEEQETPAGRLLLATDLGMAGDAAAARAALGDPEELSDPLRSRAHILLGGLALTADPVDAEAAVASYLRALDCQGDGCLDVSRRAWAGLTRACSGLDPGPDVCGGVNR